MAKNEYFACPVCGMNKIVSSAKRGKKTKSDELQWPVIDLKSYFVLQVREGGGKKPGASGKEGRGKAPGSGFHLIPAESLTFAEVLKRPEYADIVQGFREQLIQVIKNSIATGLIKKSEII